jgi:hypothetical protein
MRETARTANVAPKRRLFDLYRCHKLVYVFCLLGALFLPSVPFALGQEVLRRTDDIDQSAGGPILYIGSNAPIYTDFDDLHSFSFFDDEISSGQNDGSGSVDALNVVWLGPAPKATEPVAPYQFAHSSDSMRVRNWQRSGFADGTLRGDAFDDSGLSVPLFAEGELAAQKQVENRVGIAYGIGTLNIDDMSMFNYSFGFFGDLNWSARVHNQIIGPKSGIIFQRRRGQWSFDSSILAMLGANASQVVRRAGTEVYLIPGALNRPLYARPVSYYNDESDFALSPTSAIRAAIIYEINDSLTLRTSWSSLLIANIYEVGSPIFRLPNPSYRVDTGEYLLHQLFCGVEYKR